MKGTSRFTLFAVLLACGLALSTIQATDALATPNANSAVEHFRVFNDFPASTLTFGDAYPASIFIQDDNTGSPPAFANLHNWHFSENNAADAVFNNGDAFAYSANLVISGTANAEAGLQLAPWYSHDVDGRLNVRVPDGEIAAFGGRLPFYSFTGAFGLHYVGGTAIGLAITYDPHSLSMADPGTIKYDVHYNGMDYTSGNIPFDQGNPAEDPPYGLWGILNDARVGGHFQPFLGTIGSARADWTNITFVPEPSGLALLGLAGLSVLRRRW